MKSINLIILFLMAVLPTYARGNLHNLQQQQEKKKKERKEKRPRLSGKKNRQWKFMVT